MTFSHYEEYLAQLQYYPSEDGKMAYLDLGKGPCLLLLHGVPTSGWLYRKIIPLLIKKGYRVIVPDMLGYGASDKPVGYEVYADQEMGKRLEGLMNTLEIPAWTHVFHDGGGLWTWALLQRNASKVERLIMLNTLVYQEGFKPPLKFEQGFIAKWYSRLYRSRLGQFLVINPTFKNGIQDRSVVNKAMLEGYKTPLLGDGDHAMYYFFTQTCQVLTDYTDLHRSLDIPLSVIWGASDDMLVWDKIKAKVRANFKIEAADIHIIKGKHFIQEEQPELISQIILDILTKEQGQKR